MVGSLPSTHIRSNQTVAGLKRTRAASVLGVTTGSNQTVAGLKQRNNDLPNIIARKFKSDRCGIETMNPPAISIRLKGSNQTVAGLKHNEVVQHDRESGSSNQTVAGLKHREIHSGQNCRTSFKSDRCGIETE